MGDDTERLRERISELEAQNAQLRQLEESVRRNGRLFEVLLRKSKDGFCLVTPQMTFLRMIRSAVENKDRNLAGRSVLTEVHPDDHALVNATFSSLLSNPTQTAACECRVRDEEGRWWWVELEMTDMLDDPDVQAIVFNNRSITQRKQYEEAIRKLNAACPSTRSDCAR